MGELTLTQEYIDTELLKLSREIAYNGKVGQRREKFCINSITRKKDIIKQINKMQNDEVKAIGKSITCRKACHYSSCCMEYVDATVRECEAIVYYLYNNEVALRLFLKNYPQWRQKVDNIQDILINLEELSFDFMRIHDEQRIGQASKEYYRQKIPCPFLDDNLCYIYEVRPYVCAGYYVTTPVNHCDPSYIGEVPVKRHLPHMEIFNKEFYFNSLERPILVCMPKAVYGILEKGYFYLCEMPGLKGLEREAIRDKKIRSKYIRYISTKQNKKSRGGGVGQP